MSKVGVRSLLASVVAAGLGAALTIAPAGIAGAAGDNSPGVTSNSITIGLDTSLTGPAASGFPNAVKGIEARFALQNAHGGIDGRKLKLLVADDGSSFTGAQTAVADLVEVKHVFGLIFISDLTSGGAYKLPQQLGVPVVGFPTDGPEWGEQPNTNMVSTYGDVGHQLPTSTADAEIAKLVGATNMGVLALANEPPSDIGGQYFEEAAKEVGVKIGYKNYSIPFGSVNVGPIVLGMKSAGVQGFISLILENSALSVLTAAKQAGLVLKAPILSAGYGQDILNSPTERQAADGAIFFVSQVPVEEHTPATRAEQAAFAKYEHFSGVPDLNWTQGWIAADIWIKGLEKAGKNPTRASFLRAIRSVKGYTANGLLPQPLDFSLKDFGHNPPTSCLYFVRLEGSKFVPLNKGKPLCGKTVNRT